MAEAAFTELQNKLIQKNGAFKQATQQARITQTQQARSKLVAQELEKMSDSTACYECIGRAYFSKPKQEILSTQQGQAEECVQQLAELRRISETASRDIRGVESEIKEFLRENQDFAQKFLAQSA